MRVSNERARWLRISLVFALAALLLAARAEAKPNFSGQWKLDTSKSDFGPLPPPNSRTDKITHEDPSLKQTVSQSGQNGDFTYDLNYSTDGKETTNEIRGSTAKSTSKWDGDALVIDIKASFGGNDFTIKDRWTLSEDGKILTVSRHLAGAQGEADQKLIFEKQ